MPEPRRSTRATTRQKTDATAAKPSVVRKGTSKPKKAQAPPPAQENVEEEPQIARNLNSKPKKAQAPPPAQEDHEEEVETVPEQSTGEYIHAFKLIST